MVHKGMLDPGSKLSCCDPFLNLVGSSFNWQFDELQSSDPNCPQTHLVEMRFQSLLVIWVLRVLLVVSHEFCPGELRAVYADMHDGDKKEVTISGTSITIKPSGNNQTWLVKSEMSNQSATCGASINFNVPGKPNPPPVNLSATFFYSVMRPHSMSTEFGFTDPTGTIAAKNFPLNRWIQLSLITHHSVFKCPTSLTSIYADMHDGDRKEVQISGSTITIKPSGNNQTWVVKSTVDAETCSASVNFNVPGKPSPPPVPVTATLVQTISETEQKFEFEFTDPSGTLAPAGFPLNHWVDIGMGVVAELLV